MAALAETVTKSSLHLGFQSAGCFCKIRTAALSFRAILLL
ncbi:hypothetical protein HMPREF9098_2183 [Kingella denitrificans ATCC 33394]|uniref:Uncharacterized protein n=1 Tax=Kingella denitrificans ATCC 33394 TaxID=888741 RepID=F0F248_9NEIS|nr:hypothetical protein HMPREF9098_2183 [Kingella denitrificans ATCC 33394]